MIVLLSKQDPFSDLAAAIARSLFQDRLTHFSGNVGDPLPAPLLDMTGHLLVSFLSPWIIPQALLDASEAAINFHPASSDYPGIGCYNFALYEEAEEFGAICHHMLARVDSGAIVEERRFPVFPSDTVESLKLRTMVTMLSMFHDLMSRVAGGHELPLSQARWSRAPFTRRGLQQLKIVDPAMPADEVRRRVRATTYPGYPGASVVVGGEQFHFPVPDRPPIA